MAVRRGKVGRPPLALDWATYVELFAADCELKGRRPRTIALHKESLAAVHKLLQDAGGDVRPENTTQADLTSAVRTMLRRGLTPRTVNLRMHSTRAFFGFLLAKGMIKQDPSIEVEQLREDRQIPRALGSVREIAALLAQPDRSTFVGLRDHCMLLLQLDTGLRLGEVLGLNLADIDPTERIVRVRAATTKTRREREVPISSATRDALRAYIAERGALITPRLFISREEKPLAANSYQKRIMRYARRAGLAISSHGLRHTFGRLFIAGGGSSLALQNLLGHSTTSMTSWYAQLWGQDLRAVHDAFSPVARLPSALAATSGQPSDEKVRRAV